MRKAVFFAWFILWVVLVLALCGVIDKEGFTKADYFHGVIISAVGLTASIEWRKK